MRKKPNPELIDNENPAWTAGQIANARPAREVLPQIFGAKVARKMLKPSGSKSKVIVADDEASNFRDSVSEIQSPKVDRSLYSGAV